MSKTFLLVFINIFPLSYSCLSQEIKDFSKSINEVNLIIDSIETLFKNEDTLCTKTVKKGLASPGKKAIRKFQINDAGSFAGTSFLYNRNIFKHNRVYNFLTKEGLWQINSTYYFINNKVIKFEEIDYLVVENDKTRKLNHSVILYLKNDELIKKEEEIYDNFKLTGKLIKNIINFSKQFESILIR